MAKNTQVILRAAVEDLGYPGDIVEVAPGYARNFLLPRGLAYVASEASIHRVAQEKEKVQEKLAHEKVRAEAIAAAMADVEIEFRMMAGDEGQLYGSVAAADIGERLAEKGFEIERQRIKLDAPIKALGEYQVPIRLHPEVTVQVRVKVGQEQA